MTMESHESSLVTPANAPAYVRYRDDGWPLCPGCGEDALWSSTATADSIVCCFQCDWRPGYLTAEGEA